MQAQVLSILARRRWDPMSISQPGHFRLRNCATADAQMILDDPRISLYCLDQAHGQAVFVELPPDVDLSAAAFCYQTQFANATRLLSVSLDDFHRLADQVTVQPQRIVTIHSVGRCGSTLLSKMFAGIDRCWSLSEPDVYSQLLIDQPGPAELARRLHSSTRLYFQCSLPRKPTHLVLKFRSFCIELAAPLYEACQPQTVLFLYRGAEQVVHSGMRAFRQFGSPLAVLDLAHRLFLTRPLVRWALGRHWDLGTRLFPWMHQLTPARLASLGPVGVLTVAWLSAMDRCLSLQREGIPVMPLRYDDLVAAPEPTMQQVLIRCGLSAADATRALDALRGDSQSATSLARGRQRKWTLSARDRRTIEQLVSQHPLIRHGDMELPETLRP